ncbi:MAG TPA: hypothetical protein VFX02_13975 [Gammaproteobacteria bacterium]|nr:hypothetical protein [Gammaproteobacteria bacterium]
MIKALSKLVIVLGLSMLAFSSGAQTSPTSGDIVMKGTLGDCPKGRPCMYRVTKDDITISRGMFRFSARSTGLCYEQIITINNNGRYVHQEHMVGTDSGTKHFGVRVNDLLTVYVVEIPSDRLCFWPGELSWQISRNSYSVN